MSNLKTKLCDIDIKNLQKVIRKAFQFVSETIKQYRLRRNKMDAFYLSLSLNHVDENLTSETGKVSNYERDVI